MFWVEVTFECYENDMIFHVFNFSFLFRTSFQKWYLDGSVLRHCHGHFSESDILKVTWSQLCPKFLLNNCEGHWWHSCEAELTILPTWITIRDNSFIKTWVKLKDIFKTITCKKNIAPKYVIFFLNTLLYLSNKLIFQI